MAFEIQEHSTFHNDRTCYTVFPSICVLQNGDWLLAFSRSKLHEGHWQHPPTDPDYRTYITRSSDHGKSWTEPRVVPHYDWSGTENPGIMQASDGTVVLTSFRFRWYPLELARKRWEQGEEISLNLPERHWTKDISEEDWELSKFNRGRTNDGTYVFRSHDNGLTFDDCIKLDPSTHRSGYTRVGAIELSDGRLAYAVSEHFHPTNRTTYVHFSEDKGKTWSQPTVIAQTEGPSFNEPCIVETAPGEIFCILRDRDKHEYLWGCRSTDGGATWSVPEKTPMWGHPAQLTMLADGRLLCTYGYRDKPAGVRVCTSQDGGRTWDEERILRDDFPNRNVGYPASIEFEPGHCFCAYYGQQPDGSVCLCGTWFSV